MDKVIKYANMYVEVQVKLKGYPTSYMSQKRNIWTSVTVEIAPFLSWKIWHVKDDILSTRHLINLR